MESHVIRGQYAPGKIKGVNVAGYKQEKGVLEESNAETFVAAKIFIDNPRWKDVPFYIRGGKRLSKQTTEIVVTFKNSNLSNHQAASNILFIRIQPNAGVFLKAMSKAPTLNENIAPVLFGYNTDSFFKTSSPEAYEKIFYDSIIGDHSLFVTMQEQLATWDLLTPVLDYWNSHPEAMETYEAGSWGPSSADKMLEEKGHQWHLLENENLKLGE
jgi:glucose-6-phosphate 1-dehydrogenase